LRNVSAKSWQVERREEKKWKEKGSVKSEKRVDIYSSFTVMLIKRI
jgi:hypothetical protein